MSRKVVCAFLAAIAVSVAAFAQEDGNRDADGKIVRGPYETNSFGSNWFVSVGGGIDLPIDGVKKGGANKGDITPAIDVNFGKWFTPSVGGRFGYEGWATKASDVKVGNHFFHGDLMWNLSNAIGGYKQTRVYNFIPYASAGVFTGKKYGQEFDLSAGLLNNFRLSEHWLIFIDARFDVLRAQQFGGKGEASHFSASAGLTWNIGKSYWTRSSAAEDQSAIDALKDAVKALENANKALADDKNALEADKKSLEDANKALADDKDALEADKKELQDAVDSLKNRPAQVNVIEKVTEHIKNGPLTLYFGKGQSVLSELELQHLAYYIEQQQPGTKYTLVGSADVTTGSRELNEALCKARVDYVVAKLRNYGVKDSQITIKPSVLADIPAHPEFGRSVIIEHE